MSSRLSYVWLSLRRGLGARMASELLRDFASPDAVFAADRQALTEAPCGLKKAQVDALCDKNTEEAARIIEQCTRDGIQIVTLGDSAYPDRLRAIADAPLVLYVRGRWPDFDVTPAVAVVGTRSATPYGVQTAEALGSALGGAGFITVSGMALGIDGAAHKGALRADGITVAVLAGGADVCYPPQHRGLMGDILLAGAVVSEYPPGTEPMGTHYHNRNRIISGLSVASVIVEAADYRSGALITARHALDQGRDVYAVPGALDAPQSSACNRLIEKGEAALLRSPQSLVNTYSSLLRKPAAVDAPPARQKAGKKQPPKSAWDEIHRREKRGEERKKRLESKPTPTADTALPDSLSEDEKRIAQLVREGVSMPEELIERCGLPAPRVMSIVTMLEMDGILRREKGLLMLGKW